MEKIQVMKKQVIMNNFTYPPMHLMYNSNVNLVNLKQFGKSLKLRYSQTEVMSVCIKSSVENP